MGCGALCGDVTACDVAVAKQGKLAMDRNVCQLARNQEMAKIVPFSSFIQAYQSHPASFFLQTKKQVKRDDKVRQEVLLKWKVVILGGEKLEKSYLECLGLNSDWTVNYSKCDDIAQTINDSSLIYHQIWKQIEKDIGRTFKAFQPFQPSSQMLEQFSLVLKQITNHFPKMGYCQSLNFIVGYLLVLGFSQKDSFQVFVCLATSKRFLLLGMYEEKFPLYDAFFLIFRNALKRMSPALYSHIFDMPDFTHHLWLFKWLSNLFINFLPNQILPYVWDFVIMSGSIGMIIIALCLLQHLQATILGFSDVGDLNDFFNSLKNLNTFNQKVNLNHFINRAYQTELIEKDFDRVELEGGFYGVYLKATFKKTSKNFRQLKVHDQQGNNDNDSETAQKILKSWRSELVEERKAFRLINQKQKKDQKGEKDSEDIQVVILQSPIAQQNEKIEQPVTYVRNQSILQKVEYQFNKINQKAQEEDQSVISQSSSHSKTPKAPQPKTYNLDELSKLQLQFYSKKKKLANSNPKQQPEKKSLKVKDFKVFPHNTLSIAGRISMKAEISYDAISISSKKNSNKSQIKSSNQSAKVPPQQNGRLCGCKTKTEENKCLSSDQNSELGESKYQFSEKDSVSINNYSHKSEANQADSVRDEKSHRERVSTHAHYLNNSAFTKPQAVEKMEAESEVVVFPFKKRARINMIAAEPQKHDFISKISWQPEQQSLQQLSQVQLPEAPNNFPHI